MKVVTLLARLLLALCVLTVSNLCFAFERAPVCDPVGASAVAPIPVLPLIDPATWEEWWSANAKRARFRTIEEEREIAERYGYGADDGVIYRGLDVIVVPGRGDRIEVVLKRLGRSSSKLTARNSAAPLLSRTRHSAVGTACSFWISVRTPLLR